MNTHGRDAELPIIFAACDPKYFAKHGRAFVRSALAAGHRVHISVHAKPGAGLQARTNKLSRGLIPKFLRSLTDQQRATTVVEAVRLPMAKTLPPDNEIFFYQRLRFLCLKDVVERYQRPVLTLDIDSLIRGPVKWDRPEPIGLYVRDDPHTMSSKKRMKREMVMGGFVYIDPKGADFVDTLVKRLKMQGLAPYSDQIALFHIYGMEDKSRIFNIAETGWFDWSFGPDSLIWTAKGARRRRAEPYIRARLDVEGMSFLSRMIIALSYRGLRLLYDRKRPKKKPAPPGATVGQSA